MSEHIIGVDIGGTTVKIGLISDDGDILEKWEIPTNLQENGAAILTDIWASIKNKLETIPIKIHTILGIGVGAPGFIDVDSGLVYEAVNIGWKNINIAEKLKAISGLPVFLANDANVAALGENWRGAGNQEKNVIAITLGTGVGGGIIVNGAILNGENGTAGEIGHLAVDPNGYRCNCGRIGCLETIASATGIVRQALDTIENNPNSLLSAIHQQLGEITAKDVFDLATKGDEGSKKIINRTVDVLGLHLANTATLINPSKILIGGGVSNAGDQLLKGIKMSFQKYALPRVSNVCEIKIAQLGNDAGIIGAAFLVKQKLLHTKF